MKTIHLLEIRPYCLVLVSLRLFQHLIRCYAHVVSFACAISVLANNHVYKIVELSQFRIKWTIPCPIILHLIKFAFFIVFNISDTEMHAPFLASVVSFFYNNMSILFKVFKRNTDSLF